MLRRIRLFHCVTSPKYARIQRKMTTENREEEPISSIIPVRVYVQIQREGNKEWEIGLRFPPP